LDLPVLVWCSAEEQYRRFSRNAVDPKEVIAVIEYYLSLGVYPRPSVLCIQELIPAGLALLV
jgi:hypothetical protein